MVDNNIMKSDVSPSVLKVSEGGIDLVTLVTNKGVVETPIVQAQPPTLPAISTTLPIDSQASIDTRKAIWELTCKAVHSAILRVQELLDQPSANMSLSQVMDAAKTLTELMMAQEWAVRFEKAILKNPAYLNSGKASPGKLLTTQSTRASQLAKMDTGDKRLQPSKLLAAIPHDEKQTG